MSTLEMYCKEVQRLSGLSRQSWLRNLRDYINYSKTETLIEEIGELTDLQHIKIIWEAGAIKHIRQALLTRHDELKRRRTP